MDITFTSTINDGFPVKIECELDGGVWHVTGIYHINGGNISDRTYNKIVADVEECKRIDAEAWYAYRGY